jgi:Ca2+-transporting ATPase
MPGSWHTLTAAEALDVLESPLQGLSSDEAERRLVEHGPNVFGDVEPPSRLVVFLRQFRSPLIAILLVAAVVTSLLREWKDTAVIVVIMLLNAVIGFVQERKADASVRALMQMAVPKARVVRDGREIEIDGRDVVPGDLVLLESGTRVPADLRLVSVRALLVDESLLTGEWNPVAKHTRALDAELSLGDRGSVAYAGSTPTRGRGAGVVVATGESTEIGGIAGLIRSEPQTKTPLGQRMDQLARFIGVAVVLASLAVFAIGLARGGELSELFLAAVALAVAAAVFTVPLRDNPFQVAAVIGAFAVHVDVLYFPPNQLVLRIELLDLAAWVRIAAIATVILVVVEVDKAIRRWRARTGRAGPPER